MGKQLVLAYFENEAAADAAVEQVKAWDKADRDVKLGAIGVLVKDEKGKLKTHKLGKRKTAGGAVLFALLGFMTAGTIIGLGAIGGAVVGAGVGSLFHKGLKMSKEEKEKLNQELDGGKAVVGLMVKDDEVVLVSNKMAELGGKATAYEISEEAVEDAQKVAEAAPEEPEVPAAQ